jgi:hypothetical protein
MYFLCLNLVNHKGHDTPCLCVIPDGEFAYSSGEDGKILNWELAAGKIALIIIGTFLI